jgi:hypothetical protein
MRTFIIILGIIAALLGAIVLYLALTTPGESVPVRFPLSASQRALVARVPASADAFAIIPTAALLQRKLLANPVTRDAIERWVSEHDVPRPWLIGGGDAVLWRQDKKVSYAIRLDPFRAFLVRLWLMSSTDAVGVWDGRMFVIGNASGSPMGEAAANALLAAANGLPQGDVLVVQRDRARGMFPPIGRPAVTSVSVNAREIVVVSRSATTETSHPPIVARHPRGALLSASFATPPRILDDVQRLLGTDISALVGNGGSIALYDIDTGTLLPRPKGVISIPANDQARAAMQDITRVAQLVGETRDTGTELLVSFDRESMPLYLKDAFQPAPWPATSWSLRIDAPRLTPILEQLSDNRGLRLVAPRLHRAARDLRRWIGALRQAESIEATESVSGGFEELRVRIASK